MEKYDAHEVEAEILDYWEKQDIYRKAKEKNQGKERFTFLQGPPYTSGRLHIGHAWNNSLKDVILRYKRMQGFDVWDRAGYDMHGLPTENKVQAKHDLKYKEDIETFGIKKFVKECIQFSTENAEQMDEDLWKLGIWMDYENAYWPIRNDYIENEWWLIAQADKNKRIYKDKKVMTWCAHCETSLAKHELEYETLKEPSIFLKFRVADNEYLLIWTTTPWTIPFNLAVMVNPELNYVKIKVDTGDGEEYWIVAEALVGTFMGAVMNKKYELIETFPGKKLEGMKYEHPLQGEFDFAQEGVTIDEKNRHTVILSSEYVDTSAGTGLVHCAPGCGPEDFEVGRQYGLGAFNTLSEQGRFPESMGPYAGRIAKEDDSWFVEHYRERGCLLETTEVEHEYPHCWRCHKPVVFRTTDQWFFKVEDLRGRIIAANKKVNWVPEFGQNAYDSWIENLKDNSITRQRYWGCPVPIWECECGKYHVFGSAEELSKKAIDPIPENLHRPWIDDVRITCDCGKEVRRIPDVLDVWIDSGTAGWNCYNYPKEEKDFAGHFPADLILEATEQVRLWFSMLQIAYTLAFEATPLQKKEPSSYRNVYMHGMILDFQGLKMSKSLGNIISPYEVIEKYSADVLRYYMCGVPAGQNISFQWEEVKQRARNLGVLYNVTNYLLDFVQVNGMSIPKEAPDFGDEERFMLSKLNSTIQTVTRKLDAYHLDEAIDCVEECFLTLSRTYMQLVREKSSTGTDTEKEAVAYTIAQTLDASCRMLAVYCPFITEKIYLRMREVLGRTEESIHLCPFPPTDEGLIDEDLEQHMAAAESLIQSILAAREKAKINVRWPVARIVVDTVADKSKEEAIERLGELIQRHTNVRKIEVTEMFEKTTYVLKANFQALSEEFGQRTGAVGNAIQSLSSDEAKQVYRGLVAENSAKITVEGGMVLVKPSYVEVEITPQDPFVMADSVYLDTRRTEALDDEGFAREVARRIQVFRKDAGLRKDQEVDVLLHASKRLQRAIDAHKEMIEEKCGVRLQSAMPKQDAKEYSIKDEQLVLGLAI